MSTQTPQRYTIESSVGSNTVGPIDRDLSALDNALMVCDILREEGINADYSPAGGFDD